MLVVPNGGERIFLEKTLNQTLEIVLFTNAYDEANPIPETLVYADLIEAASYTRPQLVFGDWVFTNGDPTEALAPTKNCEFTAVPAAPVITGWALVQDLDNKVIAAEVFETTRTITAIGDIVPVRARITCS
jgi:hypothetical protein